MKATPSLRDQLRAQLDGETTTYSYDPTTGGVATVSNMSGVHRYSYDVMGRLDSLVRLSGRADSVSESWTYDLESRRSTRVIPGRYNDGFRYDPRGRVVGATGTDSVQYDPIPLCQYE